MRSFHRFLDLLLRFLYYLSSSHIISYYLLSLLIISYHYLSSFIIDLHRSSFLLSSLIISYHCLSYLIITVISLFQMLILPMAFLNRNIHYTLLHCLCNLAFVFVIFQNSHISSWIPILDFILFHCQSFQLNIKQFFSSYTLSLFHQIFCIHIFSKIFCLYSLKYLVSILLNLFFLLRDSAPHRSKAEQHYLHLLFVVVVPSRISNISTI